MMLLPIKPAKTITTLGHTLHTEDLYAHGRSYYLAGGGGSRPPPSFFKITIEFSDYPPPPFNSKSRLCTVQCTLRVYDDCNVRESSWAKLLSGLRYTMCKCTITILVCTVHVRVHRMPYAVSVCANTFTRSVDAKY